MSARDLLRAVLDILDAEDEQKVKTDINKIKKGKKHLILKPLK